MLGNIPQVTIGGRPLGFPTNIGFAMPINLIRPIIKAVLEKSQLEKNLILDSKY